MQTGGRWTSIGRLSFFGEDENQGGLETFYRKRIRLTAVPIREINRHLSAKDSVLAGVISRVPLPDRASTQNVFHDLMSCLLEQQIHYRSTKRIFQKMMDAAGVKTLTVGNFSTLEREAFHNLKLSARKYETIALTLDFFSQNTPDWAAMDDEAVRATLSQINGIGPWTADMILLYTLERPDVFPADDYHLKQIMTSLYRLNPGSGLARQMKEVAAAWSPYRSTGVRYLLAWKEFQSGKV